MLLRTWPTVRSEEGFEPDSNGFARSSFLQHRLVEIRRKHAADLVQDHCCLALVANQFFFVCCSIFELLEQCCNDYFYGNLRKFVTHNNINSLQISMVGRLLIVLVRLVMTKDCTVLLVPRILLFYVFSEITKFLLR